MSDPEIVLEYDCEQCGDHVTYTETTFPYYCGDDMCEECSDATLDLIVSSDKS